MAQLTQPVEPFGEVNVLKKRGGGLEVVATILMEPDIEGARCGLAFDASASMKKMYGANLPVGGLFSKAAGAVNVVEPVARTMAAYLARFSSTSKVNLIYWACNPDGSGVEVLGEVNEAEAKSLIVKGPRKLPWGRGTKLLPPVRHFVEDVFLRAPWAIAVFITDGIIEDLEAVKEYCVRFAEQISAGQREFIKLVLIGVGEEVDEKQMEELDDMFEGADLKDKKGNDIDLWDHKLASEMRQIEEIFAEVVSADMIVATHGRVLDSRGRVIKEYADGLPALLRFDLPAAARSFTLALPEFQVTQDLDEALGRL
jgi:hypothetical protein